MLPQKIWKSVPLSDVDGGRENNIALFRILGALLVLWGHGFALLYGPSGGGEDELSRLLRQVSAFKIGLPGLGVSMFFLISGYLVTRSFTRSSLKSFFLSRALRIYPALFVAVVITCLIGLFFSNLDAMAFIEHPKTWKYFSHNILLFDFNKGLSISYQLPGAFSGHHFKGVNGNLWTLPVELFMYLWVALLGVLGILRSRIALNLFAVFAVVAVWKLDAAMPFLLNGKDAYLCVYFLVGALAFVNRRYLYVGLPGFLALSFFLAVTLWLRSPIAGLIWVLWLSFLLLWLAFHPTIKLPQGDRYGDLSYGIYLYAFPVQQALIAFGVASAYLLNLASLIIVSVLAYASWNLIEQPALRLKPKLV